MPSTAPSLSIVIPIYNEPHWITVTVADAVAAVTRTSFAKPEMVIVDDGSNRETREALARLRTPFPLRVVRQENKGRFIARQTGIQAARGEIVLLLDARVSLHPDGLKFVYEQLETNDLPSIWNGHCEIELRGNPYARFWNVLTEIAYRDYLANPRTMSYGIELFDRYPKGTGCFLAPREALLNAIENFDSRYSDPRNANDDTSMIRQLATRQPINISPGFACVYRARDSLIPFLRHAFYRGGFFVDGWARSGGRFSGVILAFYPLSVLALAVGLRHPKIAFSAFAAAPVASAAAGTAMRRSRADCLALGMLGAPWLCVYGAGMWRGLYLALSARLTHSPQPDRPLENTQSTFS
ncbi:MAG TPA: glycosyltransferase family 2 protein [Solirubrobacteraceae bacterium]|nr:glycosyltransferase family 2 protein [Solirubrobacteraceae bacterium]